MPGLAAHENTVHRPGGADAQGRIAAFDLYRRSIAEVRPVALPRVDDEQACLAGCRKYFPARSNRRMQARYIIAERRAEAATPRSTPG